MILMRALVLLGLAVPLFTVSACSRASAGEDPSKVRVGIVFDIGGKDDRSFNAAAWAGVKCAETGMLPDGDFVGDVQDVGRGW